MKFGLFSLFDFFPDRQNEVRYYQDTLDLIIRAEQFGFDRSGWVRNTSTPSASAPARRSF